MISAFVGNTVITASPKTYLFYFSIHVQTEHRLGYPALGVAQKKKDKEEDVPDNKKAST